MKPSDNGPCYPADERPYPSETSSGTPDRIPDDRTGIGADNGPNRNPDRGSDNGPDCISGGTSGKRPGMSPDNTSDCTSGCSASDQEPQRDSDGSGRNEKLSWRERLRRRRTAMLRRIEYNRLRRIRRLTVPKYTHCKNCGTRLEGMYCHRCGQYALDIEQPFWKYFKQYFENVYQFDSKVWQTLWLLFRRPGLLTLEFNAGKINSYVHPLRLFMFISALFFLAVAFFIPEADKALGPVEKQISALRDPFILESIQSEYAKDPDGFSRDTVVWVGNARSVFEGLESLAEVRDRPGHDTLQVRLPMFLLEENYLIAAPRDSIYWSSEDPQRPSALANREEVQQLHREMVYEEIIGWFSQWLPVILLLFIPLFALLLHLFFRRSRMLYMGHFVTALHLHSVQLILVFILLFGVQWVKHPGNLALLMLALYLLHMVSAFHRIYGNSWGRSAFKALVIHGFYMTVMVIVLFAIFIWLLFPLMKENNWW